MSIHALQAPPAGTLLLLSGKPGAGKSTFCYETAVRSLADGRPVIFLATGQNTPDLLAHLRDQGLGEPIRKQLAVVDAFSKTVGLPAGKRPDTAYANAHDFNSLSIAVSKQQQRLGAGNTLLLLDALTDPYLFGGAGVLQFMRLFLAKFASEGNAVMATIDEGCGSQADLVAMQSLSGALVQLCARDGRQQITIVKHPTLPPSTTERAVEQSPWLEPALEHLTPQAIDKIKRSFFGDGFGVRPILGDFLHPIWPNMAYWSGMLWDPQRFPQVIYEHNRDEQKMLGSEEHQRLIPRRYQLLFKAMFASRHAGIFPRNFSRVADMKTVRRFSFPYMVGARVERSGIIDYLPQQSRRDEHHYRIDEQAACCGFEHIGASMGWYLPPMMAGQLAALEEMDRPWTAVETRCVGLGDPYCEVAIIPGDSPALPPSLVKDAPTLERIHARLADQAALFLLDGTPLPSRPTLGPNVHLQPAFHAFGFPHIAGQRSQMAMRLGGAKLGGQIGRRLAQAGMEPLQAAAQLCAFLNETRAGIATFDQAAGEIRIQENIEPQRTILMTDIREPSCYFTTGFLSGFFSALAGHQVQETRCLAAGDSHCAWTVS